MKKLDLKSLTLRDAVLAHGCWVCSLLISRRIHPPVLSSFCLITWRPGYSPPSVTLQAYPSDNSRSVSSHLIEYFKQIQPFRGKETQLFVTFTRPHKAIPREILSRWIRTVISSAGIDVASFKPLSTRSAATSKAKAAYITIDLILSTVGWCMSRSFDRFYDKQQHSRRQNYIFSKLWQSSFSVSVSEGLFLKGGEIS